MDGYIIRYHRIWLSDYIENLQRQSRLLTQIKYCLQADREISSPEQRAEFNHLLKHVEQLNQSLETTQAVLRDYLENAQEASIRLQKECRKIQLPNFIE